MAPHWRPTELLEARGTVRLGGGGGGATGGTPRFGTLEMIQQIKSKE